MSTLPLSDIVDVTVSVGPVTTVRTNFNLGLIVGSSTIISATDRVATYSGLTGMKAGGWLGTEPEYLAAQIYFSQSPKPSKVAIGRWDSTGETAVAAVTACRETNSEWYGCTVCGADKANIEQVSAYIESCDLASAYFYTTGDSDVLAGTSGNTAEYLKGKSYGRTLGQYATTTDNAVVAIMGYAMAANTQTSSSAYTLKFKSESGVTVESLTSTQLALIKNNNCNVYINRGSTYNLFEDGIMADGTHFDRLIGLDVLTNNLQTAVLNALQSNSKIAQTDDGMDLLLNYLIAPLEKARTTGFIAAGTWEGNNILTLSTGDTLSRGYKIMSGTIAEQSTTDRAARKAPPIYICIKLAGAMESVSIGLYVNE